MTMLRQTGSGERARRVSDGAGGWTREWLATETNVRCKLDWPSAGSENTAAGAERQKVTGMLYVDENVDIARDDRWTVTGGPRTVTVTVLDVRSPGGRPYTLAPHLECEIEQIQQGT